MDLKELINTLFLLILLMFSNYLYELFPKQLNNFFTKSILAKHVLIIFLIFFSFELINATEDSAPLEKFYMSLILYVFYIFFNKTNLYQSILIIALLIVNYIIINQQNYLQNINQEYLHLDKYINILGYITLGVMLISFLTYFYKQLVEQEKFSIFKFWFGTIVKN